MDFIKTQFNTEIEYQDWIAETIGINYGIFKELETRTGKNYIKNTKIDFSFVSDRKEKLDKLTDALNEKYKCQLFHYEISYVGG